MSSMGIMSPMSPMSPMGKNTQNNTRRDQTRRAKRGGKKAAKRRLSRRCSRRRAKKETRKEEKMLFTLKIYDTELMTFELTQKQLEGFCCQIISVREENKYLLPIGMALDGEGVLSWLKSRVIPQNREFADKILSVYGLAHNNILGIIKLCKGLSLNDSYWLTEPDFKGKFADYNLFENSFYKALSLIAYTGYGSVRPSGFSSSPEFTTNGMLRKGWRRMDGRVKLYKGGTSGAANTGNEPYSEFYAAQIAEAMRLNHVPYTLSKWKGILCCVCELFTDYDHAFVPMWRFCKSRRIREIAAYLRNLGAEYFNAFCDMMIFDALIYNTDRHLNNFGLMVDNKTNQPYAFAPIFDNGLSLFNFAMEDDFADLETYAKSRLSAFDVPFDEIARELMTSRQKEQLRHLQEFKFIRHPRYNLPAARLKALELFIRRRARMLSSW